MAEKKPTRAGTKKSASIFTEEERAAFDETVRERKARQRGSKTDGEQEVREKIAEMKGSDRVIAERLHAIIKASAPSLTPRTWYGMPAYSKDDQVVCFFQPSQKFKTRYVTLGFSDEANLDEGHMWPTSFAVMELTAPEEARVSALVKRAVG
jgi:uncharacterized protein YdhG (YjbR/CyaY superfamily)